MGEILLHDALDGLERANETQKGSQDGRRKGHLDFRFLQTRRIGQLFDGPAKHEARENVNQAVAERGTAKKYKNDSKV